MCQDAKEDMFPNKQWMEREQGHISHLPLTQVALPGSHDAGTWDIDCLSPWSPSRKEWWVKLARMFPFVTMQYAITQNYPVEEQAMRGIRYFDLRVCAYVKNGQKSYRFVHGMLGGDFMQGIKRLCKFARENTKEILILNVRETDSFTDDDHVHLQQEFFNAARERLATVQHFSPVTRVRDFWASDRNVIVIYPNADPKYGLWPTSTITTKWPNMTNAAQCLAYLDKQMTTRNVNRNQLYNLQACLTPNEDWVMKHPLTSTRQLAGSINALMVPNFHKWRGKLNCIMVDVIEYPGMVNAIIALNRPE